MISEHRDKNREEAPDLKMAGVVAQALSLLYATLSLMPAVGHPEGLDEPSDRGHGFVAAGADATSQGRRGDGQRRQRSFPPHPI